MWVPQGGFLGIQVGQAEVCGSVLGSCPCAVDLLAWKGSCSHWAHTPSTSPSKGNGVQEEGIAPEDP